MAYKVMLDQFEGPLDLLLHLIQQAEVDIYEIPVAKITEQYLQYIQTMQQLKLDIASEYLIMAATLLEIKSKQLLPKQEDSFASEHEDGEEGEEDPRQELIERLIEYRKYKEAANQFKVKEKERSLLYTKSPVNLSEYDDDKSNVAITNVTLFDLVAAFEKLLTEHKKERNDTKKITLDEISIGERMNEIVEQLRSSDGSCFFSELFTQKERSYIVVSFLALLELMKTKQIRCEQHHNFSDIIVKKWSEGW